MHIWTENPIAEIWQHLRYLTSEANVRGILTGKTQSGREEKWDDSFEIKEKVSAITSCIKQADEYFRASESVSLATRPLLQFYGTQSLSKAIILANDKEIRLEDLRYHGLSSRFSTTSDKNNQESLKRYTADTSSWLVEKEYAVTNEGVFPHLCQVTGEKAPNKGFPIFFKDLIRILPDLKDLYERHYGEISHCFYLNEQPSINRDGKYEIYFGAHENIIHLKEVFPEFNTGYEELTKHRSPGFRSTSSVAQPPTFGKIEVGTITGKYFVRPHAIGVYKSISLLYASLFILSNMVRYKPAFWMKVLEGSSHGSASVVEAVCNTVRRRIPHEALHAIWHEIFTFGSPAYLS